MGNYLEKSRIFIGGTGRSGTTILSKFFGSHLSIAKIPLESRFITDNRGVINLFDALTRNYSMAQGRMALKDFNHLMTQDLITPFVSPYLDYSFRRFKNREIQSATKSYINNLSLGTFKGRDFNSIDRFKAIALIRVFVFLVYGSFKKVFPKLTSPRFLSFQGVTPSENLYIPKFFKDEGELLQYTRSFIDTVFSALVKDNTVGWCEDTPSNIYHLDFLSKVFPEAIFIHVMRHPTAVALSMKKVVWAPNEYDQICDLLEQLLERAIKTHEYAIEKSEVNYHFVRLEDLSDEASLNRFIQGLKIDPLGFSGKIKIERSRMDYYKSEMTSDQIEYVDYRLSKYINYFGYPPSN